MKRQEAVPPPAVTAQRLHDEQVMQLVPLLRKVNLSQLGCPPPAQGLVQVKTGHVAEVGHPGDRLEEPEPLHRPVNVQAVDEEEQHVIQNSNEAGRVGTGRPRIALVQLENRVVRQSEAVACGGAVALVRVGAAEAERAAHVGPQSLPLVPEVAKPQCTKVSWRHLGSLFGEARRPPGLVGWFVVRIRDASGGRLPSRPPRGPERMLQT
mmetsp:Transcript_38293/g.96229  ORF Transcript_38293/g.96229 Transcript_38293/m.96229 type:complete len:209 (+) Transcript_38293:532-1158(+)